MYKIIIEKIQVEEVEERDYKIIWIKEWTVDEKEWGYVKIPNKREVSKEIYRQTIECDNFNLFDVINAFNQ